MLTQTHGEAALLSEFTCLQLRVFENDVPRLQMAAGKVVVLRAVDTVLRS